MIEIFWLLSDIIILLKDSCIPQNNNILSAYYFNDDQKVKNLYPLAA